VTRDSKTDPESRPYAVRGSGDPGGVVPGRGEVGGASSSVVGVKVVLVTGAGRSGTSTVAGALSTLGLHVPGPWVPADATNPRGFFESEWVVDLHKELLHRLPVVRTVDARPEAAALVEARVDDPALVGRVAGWLDGVRDGDDDGQVLLKDPRAVWFHDLWRRACARVGAELVFLTMVRHPAQVARSREHAYLADADAGFLRRRAVGNVAAWTNVAILTEQATRSEPRAFVRHADLVADWRAALAPAVRALGLDVDLHGDAGARVDDFVDPALVSATGDLGAIGVPAALADLAEAAWEAMGRLVVDPRDRQVPTDLAEVHRRYVEVHEQAVGIALDHTGAREAQVRRTARANTAERYEQRVADLEAELSRVRGQRAGWRPPWSPSRDRSTT